MCYNYNRETEQKQPSWEKSCGGFFYAQKQEVYPMPRKPKRPCAYPNCPKLTDGLYCEEHKKITSRQYEKYGRRYKRSERYGSAWQKVRDRYVKLHPFCEMCFEEGHFGHADIVHHIKPLAEGGTNDESNLMSVCFHHHEQIHRRRGDR